MTTINYINYIGFIAGACTTGSFIPQVIRVYKTTTRDHVSIGMMVLQLAGTGAWVCYGILRPDYIVVGYNGLSVLMASMIIGRWIILPK